MFAVAFLFLFIALYLGKVQEAVMAAKDARVNGNSELLGSMKVVRFQAWEEKFRKKIMDLRIHELKCLYDYSVGGALAAAMFKGMPSAVSFATFGSYVFSGQPLDVATAVTTISLLSILNQPMIVLPSVLGLFIEVTVSVD